jgi:hypothetical protein
MITTHQQENTRKYMRQLRIYVNTNGLLTISLPWEYFLPLKIGWVISAGIIKRQRSN